MGAARFTSSHWGIYQLEHHQGQSRLVPWSKDPNPSDIGLHQWKANDSYLRVKKPAIRKSWLEKGAQPANGLRGKEAFVEVEWDQALDLIAEEITRVKNRYGNDSILASPYGWSSAGRFHHAQSQARRFYNAVGGFIASRHTYSFGAAESLMPMIAGSLYTLMGDADSWEALYQHTDVMLCFGGLSTKNAQMEHSGAGRHTSNNGVQALLDKGAKLFNIGPKQHQFIKGTDLDNRCEWIAIRPGTDIALMLALSHYLIIHDAHDQAYLERYTTGFDRYADYLTGKSDGVAKDLEWASAITSLSVEQIQALGDLLIDCRRSNQRVLINMAWAIQRAENGEQPVWAALALSALLGQLGLPGAGFSFGYACTNSMGYGGTRLVGPRFGLGKNQVNTYVPVARITDMLLHPGELYPFENEWHVYPEVRLIHWAGGNPFHHHQNLNRMCDAWQKPDTIIANEQFWTPNARMADIVLPATTSLERDDVGFASNEGYIMAMSKMKDAPGEALSDHAIFAALAKRLGIDAEFCEGLDENSLVCRIYSEAQERAKARGIDLPADYEALRKAGVVEFSNQLPHDHSQPSNKGLLAAFREDPEGHPLPTPSGRIELFSEQIASFEANELKGHPEWKEPIEWLGGDQAARYPFHLISHQPANKLHSQLDHSELSQGMRAHGREPLSISVNDAEVLGLVQDQVVQVTSPRGRCLASVMIVKGLMDGVVILPTGAWFDAGIDFAEAHAEGVERHGNPNVLTSDRPSSALTQGCAAMSCLVDIKPFEGELPELSCYTLPPGIST